MKKLMKELGIGLIVIILCTIIGNYFITKKEINLKSNGLKSDGIIYEINKAQHTISYHYKFSTPQNIIFNNMGEPSLINTPYEKFRFSKDSLIGYKFRVYYDPKNSENNYMDFNEFLGIDSTLWKAARRVK